MNPFLLRFYQEATDIEGIKDPFREVIFFDDQSHLTWKEIEALASGNFPRPWFELFKLSHLDRLDFLRSYWEKILPFESKVFSFLDFFFSKIDDVVVVMVKDFQKEPYRIEMAYTMKSNPKLFFRGGPPVSKEELHQLNAHFDYLLPGDFLAFLQIHNGFAKGEDQGILPMHKILKKTVEIREIASQISKKISSEGEFNPEALIVFYQSYHENFFHCFYTEWFPKSEVGNVFYSLPENRISTVKEGSKDLAFPTFLEWLTFYMEDIET